MKKEWSADWVGSRQPRKQRKYRANAPLHRRRKMLSSHLSVVLRKELGRRSVAVRKDDEVKIVRGSKKGSAGKITRVDMKKMKIYVEGVKRKKVSGQEMDFPIDPSNVIVTKIFSDDKARIKYIRRAKTGTQKQAQK
ncbi:MAG: 50S ribosomal protein L24 [Candidatus Aenigmarchaeota archaeon]|nr:50S ribosomal protein L24 [Candidatus Aenigmarchaeota archaeon]